VKFSCERCGKRYATAAPPVPGRVYRLRCKACGHVIVLKAVPGSPAPTQPSPRDLDGELGLPAPATHTPAPLPHTGEPTTRVRSHATTPPPDGALAPPADGGYVDLFADGGATGNGSSSPGDDSLAAPATDPFAPGADPFAPARAGLAAVEPSRVADRSAPLAAPKVPDIPRPPAQKGGAPFLLVGAGALVLIGILVFVLVSGRTGGPDRGVPRPQPATRPIAARAPAPAPEPAPEPEAAPAPAALANETAKAAAPGPAPERPRVERLHRRDRPERSAQPAPSAASARSTEPPPTAVEPARAQPGLTSEQVQQVLASARKDFDRCISSAGRATGLKLDGRRVTLRLNIQPKGNVTYPTLDDVALNATALGACLKSAARLMVFPRFRGDPLRISVPLTLTRP
jgi:DNA-directed RNA polymerase subunit RPC12/RpoP